MYQSDPEILPQSENGHWLKLNEACRVLGVSEITLRRKARSGKIPTRLFEGKYYIFVQEQPVKQTPFPNQHPTVLTPTLNTFNTTTNRTSQDIIELKAQISELKLKVQEQEMIIKNQHRTIEDQQTLIALLEESK